MGEELSVYDTRADDSGIGHQYWKYCDCGYHVAALLHESQDNLLIAYSQWRDMIWRIS